MLFLLGASAALVSSLIAGTQATARIVLQHKALAALRATYGTRVARIQSALADSLASGTSESRVPDESGCALVRADGACAIEVTASSRFDAAPGGALLQQNDTVAEGRTAAVVDVVALGSSGQVLGERHGRIVFRTLHTPPWTLLSGNLDAAFDTANETNVPGDDGGMMPGTSSPGTLIDIVYQNAATGAEIPANVWRTTPPQAGGASAPWSP
ncbi:MAG: hypothetical protein ACLQPV_07395 [Vulcanimicrobiaceae bacterium]